MTQREKIDAAVHFLLSRGLKPSSATPPIYRLVWWLGLPIPPPHFQSLLGLFVFQSLFFGFIMGLAAAGFVGGDRLEQGLTIGTISGAVFGTLVTIITRFQASRLGVPRWAEFDPGLEEEEADDW